jgi:hypothetical protein
MNLKQISPENLKNLTRKAYVMENWAHVRLLTGHSKIIGCYEWALQLVSLKGILPKITFLALALTHEFKTIHSFYDSSYKKNVSVTKSRNLDKWNLVYGKGVRNNKLQWENFLSKTCKGLIHREGIFLGIIIKWTMKLNSSLIFNNWASKVTL